MVSDRPSERPQIQKVGCGIGPALREASNPEGGSVVSDRPSERPQIQKVACGIGPALREDLKSRRWPVISDQTSEKTSNPEGGLWYRTGPQRGLSRRLAVVSDRPSEKALNPEGGSVVSDRPSEKTLNPEGGCGISSCNTNSSASMANVSHRLREDKNPFLPSHMKGSLIFNIILQQLFV